MNIFHKIAVQGLKKSRARTLVTIIGVILSAAMITGVATFGISLLTYMVNGALYKYGNYHAAFFHVSSSFLQEQENNEDAESIVVLENIGSAPLNQSYISILGYDDKAFQLLPVALISGRLPENNTEILVSGNLIASADISCSIGDTISLPMESSVKNYIVVGICQTPHFEENASLGYLITKTKIDHAKDDCNLFVKLKNPRKVYSYVNTVTAKYNYTYSLNSNVLRFLGISKNAGDKIFNALLYSVGGIVIIIIMIGSVFLIHNAFHISLNERMHQFGILLSVGATKKQLRNSVLFEGLCIGTIGIPFGILLGLGLIHIVLFAVAENFSDILYADVPLTLTISIPVLLLAAFISLITILISAYLPARKAAATPVMECIRQTNEIKVESKTIKTSKLAERIYGIEGMLALKNFKRNKKRCRSIVLSLVLSIVLFISTNAFIIDLKQASEMAVIFTTYDIAITAMDIDDKEMLTVYDKLKTTDSVSRSSYQAVARYSCTAKTEDLSDAFQKKMKLPPSEKTASLSVDFQFLDDTTYFNELELAGLPGEEYTGENAKLMAIAKIDAHSDRMLEPDDFSDMFSSSSTDVTIVPEGIAEADQKYNREVTLTFVSIVSEDTLPKIETFEPKPYIFTILAPWSLKDTFQIPENCIDNKGMAFCSEHPKKTENELKNRIIGEGITGCTVYNFKGMMEENSNMIFIANVFAYTFIIMISLIAIANIFNTISTNIKLRRRELAMLRSIGISELGFQKMMNFECILYGIRALLFGLPISLIYSWLIYYGISSGGADEIDFVLPWASIGISIFSVLFIISVTMLYSVSKIKKENIIDALRDDVT